MSDPYRACTPIPDEWAEDDARIARIIDETRYTGVCRMLAEVVYVLRLILKEMRVRR